MDPNPSPTGSIAEEPSADDSVAHRAGAGDQACDDPANHRIRETSRIQVSLGEWGPRASDVGARLHISVSAVIRMALAAFIKGGERDGLSGALVPGCEGVCRVHVNAASAHRLRVRARAAGMTQQMYLDALIQGESPAPLPIDHAELRSALARSNDQLAVALADLNGWIRLVGKDCVELPADCVASMGSLTREVRAHLALAAQVLAELKPPRRTS